MSTSPARQLLGLLPLAWLLLIGCMDYKLSSTDKGWDDTGGTTPSDDPPHPDTGGYGDCWEATDGWVQTLAPEEAGGGSDTGSWCVLEVSFEESADSKFIFDDYDIVSFSIIGEDSSTDPEAAAIRGVGIEDTELDLSEHWYPYYGNYYSQYLSADAGVSPVVWQADADATQVGELNDCHDVGLCKWESFHIEIWDAEASTMSDSDCKARYIPSVYWCPEFMPTPAPRAAYAGSARRRTTTHSTCVAGAGRFQLLPTLVRDNDDDGEYGVELVPVQMSGTGRYTGGAWLRDVTPVNTLGAPLWVFTSAARRVTFWWDDTVRWPKTRQAIPSTGRSFTGIQVPGAARFATSEAADDALADLQLDMSWDCATPQTGEEVNPAPGYMISLADLGCTNAWVQRLIIRPGAWQASTTMSVELYGQPSIAAKVDLDPVTGGDHFLVDEAGLYVEGVVGSRTPGIGATVTLSTVTLEGTQVCTPGQYSLAAEQ